MLPGGSATPHPCAAPGAANPGASPPRPGHAPGAAPAPSPRPRPGPSAWGGAVRAAKQRRGAELGPRCSAEPPAGRAWPFVCAARPHPGPAPSRRGSRPPPYLLRPWARGQAGRRAPQPALPARSRRPPRPAHGRFPTSGGGPSGRAGPRPPSPLRGSRPRGLVLGESRGAVALLSRSSPVCVSLPAPPPVLPPSFSSGFPCRPGCSLGGFNAVFQNFDSATSDYVETVGPVHGPEWSQESGWTMLVGPFQLRVLCNPMILWYALSPHGLAPHGQQ
ncbi:basic proline-rich protein-like [Numida meleagris]|uniref:basic proline-rich protein-like n=1 Tax=Numida meleagris TaxID=8996 RepID=UPI000B3E1C49|nr:basic proline-rich protein-like [Numida meleagris]